MIERREMRELNTEKSVLKHQGYTFYLVESNAGLQVDHWQLYDAVIIDGTDPVLVKLLLKKLRTDPNPDLYLKPVFIIHYTNVNDPVTEQLHDGIIFSTEQIAEKVAYIETINKRMEHLDPEQLSTYEAQLFKKALNYMYTRDLRNFKPFPDISSSIAYSYPLLSIHFYSFEEAKVLEVLEWAQQQNLIWPDFTDRIYLCNSCSSGRLSYREICPSCESANLKSEDLVHHFSCGFIGPMSDFKNKVDSTLLCPKCSKTLRHIGVDYDKPSVINHCQNCNQVFQDFAVHAKCLQCAADTDVQYLVPKNIYLYKLTRKGRHAAISGLSGSDNKKVADVFGAVDEKTFTVMMHYEQERARQQSFNNTNIAVLNFENMHELLVKVGKGNEKKLITELVQIVRENINPADFICLPHVSTLYLCLRDKHIEQSERSVAHICQKINHLVSDNFKGVKLKINNKTEILSTTTPFEKQIHLINQEFSEQHD